MILLCLASEYQFRRLSSQRTVGENNIGAPKIRKKLGSIKLTFL